MPICPSCGAELNADFGMVACLNCRAISVIDMDGNVQLDIPDTSPSGPPAGLSLESQVPETPHEESQFPETPYKESLQPEMPLSDFGFGMPEPSGAPEASPSVESESGNFMAAFGQAMETSIDPDTTSEQNLSEIAEFGNSDESLGKDGLFLFDVIISGIDTKELRDAVRSSLDDSRFLWDVTQIMSTIQKGTLALRQLNPVKATIVVNRLKGLPLEIRWIQNTIINS